MQSGPSWTDLQQDFPPTNGTNSSEGLPPTTPPTLSPNDLPEAVQRSSPRPLRTNHHAKLKDVDGGRIFNAVETLRKNCDKTSPNEIYLVLNPSGVTEAAEAQFSQKARSLESWRNSLILLPIMVTWISLGLAGLAYTQSIAANSRLIAEPFLQQWAEGFPILKYVSLWQAKVPLAFGQWHPFSFGDVAVLDFIFFFVLLILTVCAQAVETKAANAANDLGAWLREECDILRDNTYARTLGLGDGSEAPEWAVLVNKSISDLQGVLNNVTHSVNSFHEVLKGDRETVTKALAAVDNLNGIYEAGRRTYEKLDAILEEMSTSFKTFSESQVESVRSLDKIVTAVSASSDAVVQLAQPFAAVGVAQLAAKTLNNLEQAQRQQKQINEILANNLASARHIKIASQHAAVYHWWDMRRLFIRFRRKSS